MTVEWTARNTGTGKTLYGVIKALWFRTFSDGPIYANFHLYNIDNFIYTPIGVLPFKTIMASEESMIILDDCYSLKNLLDGFIIVIASLSRKKGLHLYFTTQYYTSIKLVIRTLAQYEIIPKYMKEIDCLCVKAIESEIDEYNSRKINDIITEYYIEHVSDFFEYYDTNEAVVIPNERRIVSEICRFSTDIYDVENNLNLLINNRNDYKRLFKEICLRMDIDINSVDNISKIIPKKIIPEKAKKIPIKQVPIKKNVGISIREIALLELLKFEKKETIFQYSKQQLKEMIFMRLNPNLYGNSDYIMDSLRDSIYDLLHKK